MKLIYWLFFVCLFVCFLLRTAKQHFLAVTNDLGMVRVLEIPKTLYVPSRSEVRQSIRLLCTHFKEDYELSVYLLFCKSKQ